MHGKLNKLLWTVVLGGDHTFALSVLFYMKPLNEQFVNKIYLSLYPSKNSICYPPALSEHRGYWSRETWLSVVFVVPLPLYHCNTVNVITAGSSTTIPL